MAVGVLLAGMAALAITAAVAARSAPGPAAAIALIEAVVWVVRAGLEVPLPLREPVLFLSEPSGIVMFGSLGLAAVLGMSGLGLLSESLSRTRPFNPVRRAPATLRGVRLGEASRVAVPTGVSLVAAEDPRHPLRSAL